MTEAMTYPKREDAIQMARSLMALTGRDAAALELRLSDAEIDRVLSGEVDQISDPTVVPRLATWVTEHLDELFTKRGREVPPFDHMRDFWSNFASGPRFGQT